MKLYQLYRDVYETCYYLTYYTVKLRTLQKNSEGQISEFEGTSTHVDLPVVEKGEIFPQ